MRLPTKQYQVYFLDLDGTLLDAKNKDGHAISKRNIDAINEIIADGRHVVISTGRVGRSALKWKETCKLDYLVAGNGSQIFGPDNEVLFDKKMKQSTSEQIIQYALKNKLVFKIDDHAEYYGKGGLFANVAGKKAGLTRSEKYEQLTVEDSHKILLWGKSRAKMRKHLIEMKGILEDVNATISYGGWIIEITDKAASKGLSNARVAKILGVKDLSYTLHIGDTMNDASATVSGGHLLAMGNGSAELKSVSSFVGPESKPNGVALVLEHSFNGD